MSLYNCKSDGDQYRISKFSNDLDIEASYLTDGAECDCPAGHRPVCRHRIMLPRFIAKNATAGQWFHNYEHQQWIRATSDDEIITEEDIAEMADGIEKDEHLASAASQVEEEVAQDIENTTSVLESIHQRNLSFQSLPKPINLLVLAELPEAKFTNNFADAAKNEIIDDALAPKPLRRL